MKTIVFIFGTRPEAIKMAPVIRALHACAGVCVKIVVTAQHRDLLDQAMTVFGLTPDLDLDLMTPNQTLPALTARAIERLSAAFAELQPALVFVQGDTTSTFAGALSAFYAKVPVAHLEAGLRTYDRANPYPEEMNRVLTTHLAAYHFAPTQQAARNLAREGIAPEAVYVVGNTGIDALLAVARDDTTPAPKEVAALWSGSPRMLFVTAHRRENHGPAMQDIARILSSLVRTHPDVCVVLPMHPNPNVVSVLKQLAHEPRIHVLDHVDYRTCVHLMKHCYFVLTDSGGLQEEAPALGKPVLVLRKTTERPEGVAGGTARLVGTDPATVLAAADELLNDAAAYARMAHAVNPYGDGRASERIVAVVRRVLLNDPSARCEEFAPARGA